jgi:hypothetical protein
MESLQMLTHKKIRPGGQAGRFENSRALQQLDAVDKVTNEKN